ncbi:MAG: hypothetical protein QNJ46_03200 [Leptolyngbyaceae cyanobacterium MO_188.B28]|nr:hypothetical protein [Leptolyngbyaceae cyanobacterium MO_188.B28]
MGTPVTTNSYQSNPKFADQSTVYIPEIQQHLHNTRHSWISTWNPAVQLGRPTFQLSGFSRAFPLTNLLTLITQSPFRVYTVLTIAIMSFTGIFFFLFLKTMELSPLACLTAATGLSLSIFAAYWMTFVMFLSAICWACGLLWQVTEFIKRPSFAKGTGISFLTYCLLMTAYPQSVVMMGYVIGIQIVVSLYEKREGFRQTLWRLFQLGLIFISGAVATLPVYLDLFVTAQRSARLSTSDEFFLAVLPKLHNIQEVFAFITALVDPFWWGNPIEPTFPLPFYNGLSLSPLYFGLLLISFLSPVLWRQKGYWHSLILLCVLATMWPSAYLFAVNHLGFHLSRSLLLGGAVIPAFILCSYAVDALQEKVPYIKLRWRLGLVVGISFLVITGVQIEIAANSDLQIQWGWAIASWLMTAGVILFIQFQKQWLLIFLTAATTFLYSYALTLMRPPESIYTRSPLIEAVSEQTIDGSRYALFGADLDGVLPPNQETLFHLRSIHSYDSLSSRNYQNLVTEWSDSGSIVYGRHFNVLDNQERLKSQEFRLSGISLLLSRQRLNSESFRQVDEINGITLYQTLYPPILRLQTPHYHLESFDKVILEEPFDRQGTSTPTIVKEFDDYRELHVESRPQSTLLFLSQQYHPFWQATDEKGNIFQTVIVNQFYQGVQLPSNTETVVLRFQPWVLWSWIPQAAYGMLGLLFLGKCVYHRLR